MKSNRFFARSPLVVLIAGVAFWGCKKGEDAAPAEDSSATTPVAEAPKPPAEVKVTLSKKWPAGNRLVFEKSVTIGRQTTGANAAPTEQFRMTRYSADFPGGNSMEEGTMAEGAPPAAPVTLAGVVPLTIAAQKFRSSVGGKVVIEANAEGGDEGDGSSGGDDSGQPARPNPLVMSISSSVGGRVTLTYDTAGAISKVDGLQAQIHAKVLRGVPRGMIPLVGGMFSETVFREAMMFHGLLNGAELKKGDTWVQNEKAMLLLNWQQDFAFTNTFSGMKDWNGKKVAEIAIAGSIGGATEKPMAFAIAPGGTFTGTALYSPDMGVVVEQNISGSFVSQEGAGKAAMTVSNTFSRSFKVTQTMSAEEASGM
ncbi:MAG: hypothetical protein ISQ14_02855 [Verrucomicrobiae bacterium]|nr:hypothetical protein [Verrucomicrobiae bacterium]